MGRARGSLSRAASFDDIRRLAHRRLPRVVFDSIDGGSGAELTMRANREAFDQVMLRPRQAMPPATTSVARTILGDNLRMPVLLAPCGSTRVVYPNGERAVARAASDAGIAYVVPHLGGTRAADVRAACKGALWYQVYKFGGRIVLEPALERAWAAGYRTLVVTIDNGRSFLERDMRNGLDVLLGNDRMAALSYIGQLLSRPRWLAGFLRDGRRRMAPNAIMSDGHPMSARDLAAAGSQPDSYFQWSDIRWLRQTWGGKIAIKGVLAAEDARLAVNAGADAIIVSNHGGRSLDGIDASLKVLPEIAAAIPRNIPLLLDSGVRRGSDVIKALCLGASAVLIGRPYMFALAYGEPGVRRMLALIENDLHRCLTALGCTSLEELSRDFVRTPPAWAA